MYYAVAYGNVMRWAQASSGNDAMRDAYGMADSHRMTISVLPKSPKYMSQKLKRELITALAKRHFNRTGERLSGCENEPGIKNVHWTQCPKCKKSILTEPASAGQDDRLCSLCDPEYEPKSL